MRRETEALRQREKEIQQLYEFSRRLAACFTVSDLISAIQNYLSHALGQQAAFFVAMADGHFEPPKSGSVPSVVQERVASMIAKVAVPAQTIVDEPTQNVWLIRAVCSEAAVHGSQRRVRISTSHVMKRSFGSEMSSLSWAAVS